MPSVTQEFFGELVCNRQYISLGIMMYRDRISLNAETFFNVFDLHVRRACKAGPLKFSQE